ncbi:hypothetical protein JW707_02140 [Candidatus Woesearchaeota archaeon]|nr:hypothetical protein [Candidatus Woesearchaeota archaeon]
MIWNRLKNVPQEHTFKLKGGHEISNMYELALHLAGMDDATFAHHVNSEKNDFRNWVFDIVKDDHLAEKISKAKDRKQMAKFVEKRVAELEQEKRHHEKVVEHGFKWGVREFGIGLVTGLFIGLVFLRALGRI